MEPFRVAAGHVQRAQAAGARGDVRGAILELRWALSNDPLSALAHALLALYLIDDRRLYAAEHEADAALRLEPELFVAHLATAHVRVAQQRLDDADRHLDEAQRLDPHEPSVFRLRARILGLRGKKREAIAVLEQGRALEPEDERTLLALAQAHLDADDVDAADAIATQVLHDHPESHGALVLRGYVLLRRGKLADAREHAFMALRQNAASPSALRLLVDVKARSSFVMGMWWRYNHWLGAVSASARILLLLGAFTAYRVATIAVLQLGYDRAGELVSFAWLGFVFYSWTAPVVFRRMLAKEMATVRLRKDF